MLARYGVVGFPVVQSLSPAVHTAAFAELGIDAVYDAYPVAPGYEEFCAFVKDTPCRGLSVTIPHKENALRYAGDGAEALAARIGAANTLLTARDDAVRAYNTDYAAILDSLTDVLGLDRSELAGLPVALLGAGGAGRAAVAGLCAYGAHVTIYNRTLTRARDLAGAFGADARPWQERAALAAEVVINATSVGMYPDVDASPLPEAALRPGLVVFDTIYNPMRTRLLRDADAVGCRLVDGVTMFVRQAAAQFELFTGQDAPSAVMRSVLVDILQG